MRRNCTVGFIQPPARITNAPRPFWPREIASITRRRRVRQTSRMRRIRRRFSRCVFNTLSRQFLLRSRNTRRQPRLSASPPRVRAELIFLAQTIAALFCAGAPFTAIRGPARDRTRQISIMKTLNETNFSNNSDRDAERGEHGDGAEHSRVT